MVYRLSGARSQPPACGPPVGLKARLLLGLLLRAKVDRNAVVAEFTSYQ
jgi:hypothetical protein